VVLGDDHSSGRRGCVQRSPAGRPRRGPRPLDKGLVIDVFAKVSLVGIEIVAIDAPIIVASVNTYLRFAEATTRLDLHAKGGKGVSELVGGGAGKRPKWDEASRRTPRLAARSKPGSGDGLFGRALPPWP